MSPRVLDVKRCPHCGGALERPTPRMCPHCAGSLQQRFFRLGCLTSAPPVLLVAGAIAWALAARGETTERSPVERVEGAAATCADGPSAVAIEPRRP